MFFWFWLVFFKDGCGGPAVYPSGSCASILVRQGQMGKDNLLEHGEENFPPMDFVDMLVFLTFRCSIGLLSLLPCSALFTIYAILLECSPFS